jgi:hypothetical protein
MEPKCACAAKTPVSIGTQRRDLEESMNDSEIMRRIQEMVNEEHELMKKSEHEGGLDEDEHAEMRALQVNLDQCWDLLRQRRARREFGTDPDAAQVRDPSVVEGYKQ